MPEEITILYVDDEEINLFLFESAFKRSYQVLTASSAKLGLEKLKDAYNDIIVVLTDMNMPEMNGPTFLEAVRQKVNSAPPIVMMTTENSPDYIKRAMGLGAVEYIMKPFTIDILSQKIDGAKSA